jgi:flagellar basal-body rod protein FlgF
MDPLLISAASGMKARMESLDLLANNIANASTTGFKADREFYGLYKSETGADSQLPLVEGQWTDFSQGVLTPSGNPLDLGLAGSGFFALNTPNGIVYTRNGQVQISKSNQLQTAQGYTLRNTRDQGRPITVDPQQPIDVDKDGVVRQGGAELGQIEIDAIDNAQTAFKKLGAGYYAPVDPALAPKVSTNTEVHQGMVEQSNVPMGDQAVRLVSVMRQFEMLQRAMLVGSEMNKRALDEVARVG